MMKRGDMPGRFDRMFIIRLNKTEQQKKKKKKHVLFNSNRYRMYYNYYD